MKLKLIIYGLLVVTGLQAQSTLDEVLQLVQQNNKTLQALRQSTEAIKLENKTGLNPSNPEAEIGYLWGSPEAIGNRTDFSVSQSFDFPTAYHYRNKRAGSLNEQAENEYREQFNLVMLQARLISHELIYLNGLQVHFSDRLAHAQKLANAYHRKFETGDVNILERNKADLNLLTAKNKLAAIEADQEAVAEQLQALNGGKPIQLITSLWPSANLPADFDSWFNARVSRMPQLQSMEQSLAASRYQEQLNKALSLPKMSAGYTAERVVGESFSGVSFGLTIPLWENKNTVKQAKMQSLAVENQMADTRLQLYHGLKALYEKALQLQQSTNEFHQALETLNNNDLLLIALESGEISVLEYLMELSIYYDTIEMALGTKRELQETVARLQAFQP